VFTEMAAPSPSVFTAEPFTAEPFTAEPFTAEPFTAEPYTAQPYTAEPDVSGAGPYVPVAPAPVAEPSDSSTPAVFVTQDAPRDAAPLEASQPYSLPDSALVGSTPSPANGSDPLTEFAHPEFAEAESEADEDVSEAGDQLFTSVASMATEILSASPEIPTIGVPEETDSESELITKDVTLIARGRRKRFRLH